MNLPHAKQFMRSDIWRVREDELPGGKRILYRYLKILLLTLNSFTQDRLSLHASALTFYSLLSVIPVIALGFGIAKGFGFERALEGFLLSRLEGQEQVAIQLLEYSRTLLENVREGLVAGIGLLLLFFSLIRILSQIEYAFNDIWYIEKPRSISRKIIDYFSLMLICPVFFFLSSAMTVFITSGAKRVVERVWLLEAVSPAIFMMLKLIPYGLLWILFTFLYLFIPNTKVSLGSGLLAGILAGTLHQFFQAGYILFQVAVSKYNAIYGSFAALPLFFIWMFISWIIVLLGGKVAYAHQNRDTQPLEMGGVSISHFEKKLLSLQITHFLIKGFTGGKPAISAKEISRAMDISPPLTRRLLKGLVESGIVSLVLLNNENSEAYQPALDPDILTIQYVIDAIEGQGSDLVPKSEIAEKLSKSLNAFNQLIESSAANQPLKEIE